MLRSQQGYLVFVAVLLIVVVGFIGTAAIFMIASSSSATNNIAQSTQAFYLAEAGLEQATHTLLNNTIANRNACSGMNVNNSMGAGVYTVTGNSFYVNSPTSLNGALNSSATSITVISTTNYQNSGRIMVDHELIDYASLDPTHFIVVKRGADGSTAANHASGALVGQYQCNLASQGGVPNLSTPSNPGNPGGKRILNEAVQLQEGWVGGNLLSGPTTWNIAHWNTPTEKQWTQYSSSISSPQILNGVSIVSNVDAWVVGNKAAALHFNGSTWTNINTGIAGGDNLTSVSAVSSSEAWACVAQGHVYKWAGGTSWATISPNPGNTLNGISMVDVNGNGTADTGWVVGTKKTAFLYNGSTWASANTGINVDLNGVSTLSATDAWAVGNGGNIFQWNGASWTTNATLSGTPVLNSISMIKSASLDIGWAVGNTSNAWYYNGSSWVLQNSGLAGSLTLNSVVTVSSNQAWLVDSSGHIYEWNGSTWTLIYTSSAGLNGIDIVHPNSQPNSAWAENFG